MNFKLHGILSGMAIPAFKIFNKTRQNKVTVLINSFIKAVQSYYMDLVLI